MGATYRVHSLRELVTLVHAHNQAREGRVKKAIVKAARQGKAYIVKFTLPIAFRELEHSLRVESKGGKVRIVADAPHAAPVETGSRPHWPPLAPLIAWVKLRGMQGNQGAAKGKPARLRGTTTAEHSNEIALVLNVLAMQRGGSNDVDDPAAIARAIQLSIACKGTKPHRYMAKALPEIRRILDVEVRIALADNGGGTGIGAGLGGSSEAGDMAAE